MGFPSINRVSVPNSQHSPQLINSKWYFLHFLNEAQTDGVREDWVGCALIHPTHHYGCGDARFGNAKCALHMK